MSQHTPEPWKVEVSHHGACVVITEKAEHARSLGQLVSYGDREDINANANARRIVACVNACIGIGTDSLERFAESHKPDKGFGVHRESVLESQRDELLAALKNLNDDCKDFIRNEYNYKSSPTTDVVDALIAKCEAK